MIGTLISFLESRVTKFSNFTKNKISFWEFRVQITNRSKWDMGWDMGFGMGWDGIGIWD
jgi:hypothetical protein